MDTGTIRVAFTVAAVTLLALLYLALYRPTRASYVGWWCIAMLLFLAGDALYFFDGTMWQRVTNPSGNVLIVIGSAAAWAGACSLRELRPAWWRLAVGPVIVAVASALGHPATNTWAGGPFFLAAFAVYFALASRQMWLLSRSVPKEPGADNVYQNLALAMSLVVGLLGFFYLGRAVSLVAVGQSGAAFTDWFGTQATMLVQIVLLVVVAFTTSALSNQERLRDLRTRATRDGLTGLLNRGEFFRQAREALDRCAEDGPACTVIMADLDHFKAINDRFGHSTGDRALRGFARAMSAASRAADITGRVGGEEFALFLPDIGPAEAEQVTERISERYRRDVSLDGVVPTASYGIAPLEYGLDLEALLARADKALYRAKAAGRDRAMHYRG